MYRLIIFVAMFNLNKMRPYLLVFIGTLLLTQACVNNDLTKITLLSTTIGGVIVNDPKVDSTFSQENAIAVETTFQEKLDLANVNVNNINTIIPNTVVVQLNNPSDSTFSIFRDLTLSLKNATDSVAFGEIGEFTETGSNFITLRAISQDVKSMLIANDFSVEMAYTIVTDSLPTGLEVVIGVEWLIEGEF